MESSFSPTSRQPGARHRARRGLLVSIAAVLLLTPLIATSTAAGARRAPGDPTVIANWTLLAQSTFMADPAKKPQEAFLYISFVDAAMYNAVVGIDGRYRPYKFHARPSRPASDTAAAVAAAYRVLVEYSPASALTTLNAARATSLAAIPDGAAKTNGIAYGVAAAEHLIGQRSADGRNAAVLFTMPEGPGVWRPTPPALSPMFIPWMGSVKPLLVRSGAQFDPGPPPKMTSRRYTRDFNEVKAYGSATSTARTATQTATANFFSGNATVQFNRALVDQMTVRNLDIVDTARMFAAVEMSMADAVISIWHSKVKYGFWRPSTAINLADTDGNPATVADPTWVPLLVNPPYPDYVSGYSGVTGAFTRALSRTLHTSRLNVTLTSTAVAGATRHYNTARGINRDVVNARIWLGIHFRFADTAGLKMGQRVADYALSHFFHRLGDD
jgi:hypothetical protein